MTHLIYDMSEMYVRIDPGHTVTFLPHLHRTKKFFKEDEIVVRDMFTVTDHILKRGVDTFTLVPSKIVAPVSVFQSLTNELNKSIKGDLLWRGVTNIKPYSDIYVYILGINDKRILKWNPSSLTFSISFINKLGDAYDSYFIHEQN